jgi:hypothetical protein
MKKLLFFLFLIASFTAKSQTNIYQPFPTDSVIQTLDYQFQANHNYSCYDWLGDTLINGLHYLTGGGGLGIRQDIPNEKMYYLDATAHEYDISINQHLNVNDTLAISQKTFEALGFPFDSCKAVVQQIDSVFMISNYHKRYWLNNFMNSGTTYVLTSGSYICGVTFDFIQGFEWAYTLHCYRQNNTWWNSMPPQFCLCDFPVKIEEFDQAADQISLNPNPSAQTIYLNLPSNSTGRYEITDTYGKNMQNGILPTVDINISNLTSGLYFIRFTTAKGKIYTKKFIKM